MFVCVLLLGTRRAGWTASSTCSPSSTFTTASKAGRASTWGTELHQRNIWYNSVLSRTGEVEGKVWMSGTSGRSYWVLMIWMCGHELRTGVLLSSGDTTVKSITQHQLLTWNYGLTSSELKFPSVDFLMLIALYLALWCAVVMICKWTWVLTPEQKYSLSSPCILISTVEWLVPASHCPFNSMNSATLNLCTFEFVYTFWTLDRCHAKVKGSPHEGMVESVLC